MTNLICSFLILLSISIIPSSWGFVRKPHNFCKITLFFWNYYSRVRNKHTPMFINFWNFFQGLRSYYGLKRLHKFAHFKGLRLFFLSNFPDATFIQGASSIPDSRVSRVKNNVCGLLRIYQLYEHFIVLSFQCGPWQQSSHRKRGKITELVFDFSSL